MISLKFIINDDDHKSRLFLIINILQLRLRSFQTIVVAKIRTIIKQVDDTFQITKMKNLLSPCDNKRKFTYSVLGVC